MALGERRHEHPIPGARTVEQIEGIAGAIGFGPVAGSCMMEIDRMIERDPEDLNADRER